MNIAKKVWGFLWSSMRGVAAFIATLALMAAVIGVWIAAPATAVLIGQHVHPLAGIAFAPVSFLIMAADAIVYQHLMEKINPGWPGDFDTTVVY